MGSSMVQNSFNGGELSPSLWSRTDIARYMTSLKTCRNFKPLVYGGAQNRAGTRFVGETQDPNARVRLLPFSFNTAQAYVLEFGNLYMRVIKDGHYVSNAPTPIEVGHAYAVGDVVTRGGQAYRCIVAHVSGPVFDTDYAAGYWTGATFDENFNVIYEVLTPYATADLPLLKWAQSADVMTIVHPSHPPMNLSRTAHDAWTIAPFDYLNGPFLDINADKTVTVYASNPEGVTTLYASAAIFPDANIGQMFYIEQSGNSQPWEPGKAGIIIGVKRYSDGKHYEALTAGTTGTSKPIVDSGDWNDGGVTWKYLHSGFGIVRITAVAGDGKSCTADVLSRIPDSLTGTGYGGAITVTATTTDTDGLTKVTSAGHGLTVGDHGTALVTFSGGSVSSWPYQVIDANTIKLAIPSPYRLVAGSVSSLKVTSYTTNATSHSWAFGAWGCDQGYPSCVCYYQQRLMFAATPALPQTIWGSRSGGYRDFGWSVPSQSDDAIVFPMASNNMNAIKNMLPMGRLAVVTAGGEWIISSGADDALTPANIGAKQQGFRGANDMPFIGVGSTALYVQNKGRIVRDLGYEFASDTYTGFDLTVFANHLVDGYQLEEWTWQQEPAQCVWCVRSDGTLLSLTYMREQQVAGWAHHDTYGGQFESACCISEGDEDVLYVAVKRGAKRFIERMNTRKVFDIRDAFFVDCGLTFDGRTGYRGTAVDHTATTATPTVDMTVPPPEDPAHPEPTGLIRVATSADFFNFPGTSDVGDEIVFEYGGVTYRVTITEVTGARSAKGIPNRDFPAGLLTHATTSWYVARNTITGLGHLEGQTVSILADGFVQEPRVVTGGQITIDPPAYIVHVGLPIEADLETLDVTAPGGETLVDKKKTIHAVRMQVLESRSIWVGRSLDNLMEVKSRSVENYDVPPNLKTGLVDIRVPTSWSDSGRVALRVKDPLPMTVLSVIPEVTVGGK